MKLYNYSTLSVRICVPSYNLNQRKDTSAAGCGFPTRRAVLAPPPPFPASRRREDPKGGEGQQFLER